jgi:hypothetical protein
MLSAITYYWNSGSFWDKLYISYAMIMCLAILLILIKNFKSNPKKKLDFIKKATEDGNMAVGKMTCLTLHGHGKPDHYQAEYMYVVNDKKYFVTYQMIYNLPMDDRKDAMNADMLLLNLKPSLILFYDGKKPSRAISKIEVFTSRMGIRQISTPKKNVWRDVNRDWDTHIDLVSYE